MTVIISKTEGIVILHFNPYYKAIVIRKAWYWHKNRYENQ
jgi:hypothetical protein